MVLATRGLVVGSFKDRSHCFSSEEGSVVDLGRGPEYCIYVLYQKQGQEDDPIFLAGSQSMVCFLRSRPAREWRKLEKRFRSWELGAAGRSENQNQSLGFLYWGGEGNDVCDNL